MFYLRARAELSIEHDAYPQGSLKELPNDPQKMKPGSTPKQ